MGSSRRYKRRRRLAEAHIFDEYGSPWFVRGGHPAARFTNKLLRMNYRKPIVLPLLVLATGDLSHPPGMEPADPILATRLHDCIGALTSN